MAEQNATFSESWYRVANERLSLRPSVKVQKHSYRGEKWIVLQNPFTNQFYRVRPAAYEFIARLTPSKTVEQVWRECLERHPDTAPGQESVIQLLAQLYHAGLLHYRVSNDASQLFKRYEKERQRMIKGRFLNIMFMRFPLWDPDKFLVSTMPIFGKLISPIGALVWLFIVGLAIKMGLDRWPYLKNQAEGILDPNNLFLLYIAMAFVKALHELGHSYFCRKFAGEVHVMGIMLMIFTPIPYMDASSAWGMRERWKRVLVGAAGMIVEIFIASLAMIIWAKTGQGTLNSLAYNMVFIASVSTLIFNLNPLLRFDGYYILSDLVGIPNLSQKSGNQLKYLCERWLFNIKHLESPASNRQESFGLVVYGICSGLYRIIVFGGVLLLVADKLLILGIIMAVVCAIAWVLTPLFLFIKYLAYSPKLDRCRTRAVTISAGIACGVILFLQFVPFPSHFRAPGILRSQEFADVRNATAGLVDKIISKSGAHVKKGTLLVQLRNPELEIKIDSAKAYVQEVEARFRQAMQDAVPNLKPLSSLLESAAHNLQQLEYDKEQLAIKAPQNGIWIAPDVETYGGRWLSRGSELGMIADTDGFHFYSIVQQEDADRLFSLKNPDAEIKLMGETGNTIKTTNFKVIPAEKRNLPSAALGWQSGGSIAIEPQDPYGQKAAEPFFEVRSEIIDSGKASLVHGRSGTIRFNLQKEPLLPRWIRSLRQLLQKRYQL